MYDLHTHSSFSDGTLPPEKLIEEAKEKGLTLLALCDHDTAAGIPRAEAAARACGLPFLRGTEIEADYTAELHILGLGVDPEAPKLKALLGAHVERRRERNEKLLRKLAEAGMDVRGFMPHTDGDINKAIIARAMTAAGFCTSVSEAFDKYLKRGRPFDVRQQYPDRFAVLDAIRSSGGLPVLAHPMKMKCDHRALLKELREHGLWGVEAYYSTASEEQTEYFLSLAREFGLRPTCGSDFHGPHRPEAQLGCAYRDTPELLITERILKARFGITAGDPVGCSPDKLRRTRAECAFRSAPRVFSASEFQLAADRIVDSLPSEFFKGLNGGVVISDGHKLHAKSRAERPLYVLGEYRHGGGQGAYIILYYGSFVRVHGSLRGQALEEEVRRVILHEFRHHLENRAGEHDLEYEDEAYLAEYSEDPNIPVRRTE